jgi:hypothetical protein
LEITLSEPILTSSETVSFSHPSDDRSDCGDRNGGDCDDENDGDCDDENDGDCDDENDGDCDDENDDRNDG